MIYLVAAFNNESERERRPMTQRRDEIHNREDADFSGKNIAETKELVHRSGV